MDEKILNMEAKSIADEMRSVSNLTRDIDISGNVMKSIKDMEDHKKPYKINPFRWSYAITLAGLFLIIIISFSFFLLEKEYNGNSTNGNNRIMIKSVEIEGKEAKKYFYNSGNKNRVVIWVQKYSEG
ncbi:MAG: hypothetical protein KAS21_10855 [Candidatus Aminicenantes bacterium]|nr:hypothetical protein [Candidatus Aminicenantes bacterium]MCK5005582.1 hypothetical protein [Candidatus Aminicenantes bacterium]